MNITHNTKISELIKANSASIEAIVSINKHFEKLRNPILRKILASRVTIEGAAKIGGCTINDFFQKLAPLGFISVENNNIPAQNKVEVSTRPEFMNLLKECTTTKLDVRAGLTSGIDPFNQIMQTLASMPSENVLLVINTFEPIPLINILKKKGFEHYIEERENKVIYTYFKKIYNTKVVNDWAFQNSTADSNEFIKTKEKYNGKIIEIDVRELEMPLPMTTILSKLESLPEGYALFVNHKKIPQFLFPELIENKFNWLINEIAVGDVKMLIYK